MSGMMTEGVKGFMYGIVRDPGWARMPDGVGGGIIIIIIIIIILRFRRRCCRSNAYLGGCSLDSPPPHHWRGEFVIQLLMTFC